VIRSSKRYKFLTLIICSFFCQILFYSQTGIVLVEELEFTEGLSFYKGEMFTGIGFLKGKKGQFIAEVNYKNGKIHGKRISYNSRGKVLSKDKFKNGTGMMKSFYSNDHIKEKGVINNGKRQGLWSFYNQNGKLKAEEFWGESNKAELIWEKYYNRVGLLESEIIYDDGVPVEERYYDDEGNIFKLNTYEKF